MTSLRFLSLRGTMDSGADSELVRPQLPHLSIMGSLNPFAWSKLPRWLTIMVKDGADPTIFS